MTNPCIFCGRPAEAVHFMVNGPDGKNLCNDCVSMISIVANQALLGINDVQIEENSVDEITDQSNELEDEIYGDPNFLENLEKIKKDPKGYIRNMIEAGMIPDDLDESAMPEFMQEMMRKHEERKRKTPEQIKDFLDKYVIGQDRAKIVLSVALYNHAKRLNDRKGIIKKSNILMIGPSGTGKTLLAQTLAKLLDVPFAIADATSLTEAGYVGDDVENILTRLIQAADGDVKKAEKGIIFIDEIDKIARRSESVSITRDVSGEGVQHALLKIIEGAEVSVPVTGGRKHPHGQNIVVNTKNILFICGGAFDGLNKMMSRDKKAISFGFDTGKEEKQADIINEEISPDILVKYGMTPELMGRLPVIVTLDDLKEDDLVRILTEPENAIVKEYQELLAADGIDLVFRKDALAEIAKIALSKHIGARGIRSIMEDIMTDIMFTAPGKEAGKCIITKNTVHTKKPIYKVA